MKAAVYMKREQDGALWWAALSDTLPPGVNQMYSVGLLPGGANKGTGKKSRAAFFLSSRATNWKNTTGAVLRSSSACPKKGPWCSFLHLFVFENYDTDNRLKLLNDTIQGSVIENDREIRRSSQAKTVVRKKADLAFLYFLAPQRDFTLLFPLFSAFTDRMEEYDGVLNTLFEKKTHEKIFEFLEKDLEMERRLVCGF